MSDVVKINVNMIVAISEELLFKLVEFAENLGRKKERISLFKESQFISQNQAHHNGRRNVTFHQHLYISSLCQLLNVII